MLIFISTLEIEFDLVRVDLGGKLISWELISWQVDFVRVDLVAIDLVRIDLVTPSLLYNLEPVKPVN